VVSTLPAADTIRSPWAGKLDPANPLPEYPRPILVRPDWQNLNGQWDCAITPKGAPLPASFDSKITVPFPAESALSGLAKPIGPDNELWYRRSFSIPDNWRPKNILLHFGAVDWRADVFVNGFPAGSHTGGYAPFSFDITPFLKPGPNSLVVRVWDPTDDSDNPVGKQTLKPSGIWYTAVTGIWQTVWLEPVPASRILSINSSTGPNASLTVNVTATADSPLTLQIFDTPDATGAPIASLSARSNSPVSISLPNPTLWSPENPKLYGIRAQLASGDSATSYTALRSVSLKRDPAGHVRIQLNGKNYFNFGPLDQGWWPDGLYTAPTEDALLFDIVETKRLGFNMIRKHVKVEPQRWYYHCDRLGILVWQDMPSTHSYGLGAKWAHNNLGGGSDCLRTPLSKANFHKEWGEIMDALKPHPSIIVWVPFNEGWGQFDTEKVADWTKRRDPSRLVNPASGGNMRPCGDIVDFHHYPEPRLFPGYTGNLALVLGEYGGIGYPLKGHLWNETGKNWGYKGVKNSKAEVTDQYVQYAQMLESLIPQGYAAAVYTQTTDVEVEVNGFYTYDRKELKVDPEAIRRANQQVISSGTEN
jgi:beta-galactosidase/beta-glucuronidase